MAKITASHVIESPEPQHEEPVYALSIINIVNGCLSGKRMGCFTFVDRLEFFKRPSTRVRPSLSIKGSSDRNLLLEETSENIKLHISSWKHSN